MSLPCRRFSRAALLAAAATLFVAALPAVAAPVPPPRRPAVEVVFCLDTTGSMGGLIEGAKQKIWSICNQIAGGKPTPQLKVGLVAYRDKGDEYVTKVFDLTDDLDAVHANLMKFQATGGGDGPESVNQALDDAVNKIKWSADKKTLRIIYLVGDAPPHMDYAEDTKYPDTCKKAVTRGIIINSIQCGGDPECAKIWRDVCVKAEGSYAQIAQTGGVVAVDSPFDKRLAEINTELARSTLVYGAGEKKEAGLMRARTAASLPAAAAADRAGYFAKSGAGAPGGAGGLGGGGAAPAYDLLDAVKARRVNLETLKKDELPAELQKLNPKERKDYLEKVEKRRAELNREALDLDKKRSEFIRNKLAEDKKGARDSFDSQVLESLRKQARKVDIAY